MAEDVGVGMRHGPDHAPGHGVGVHAQLGVHTGDHHVEPAEQLLVAIEGAVLEDVDFDAGEDAKRSQLGVQGLDHLELGPQPVGGKTVGDGQPGRVIGQGPVAVAEVAGGPGHDVDGAAAVGPVGMAVAVALDGGQHRGGALVHRLGFRGVGVLGLQVLEVGGHLAGQRLADDRRRGGADAGQVPQPAPGGQVGQHPGSGVRRRLGRGPEGAHPVGGLPGLLEQVGDAVQRLHRSVDCGPVGHGRRRPSPAGGGGVVPVTGWGRREVRRFGSGITTPFWYAGRAIPTLLRPGGRARAVSVVGGCGRGRAASSGSRMLRRLAIPGRPGWPGVLIRPGPQGRPAKGGGQAMGGIRRWIVSARRGPARVFRSESAGLARTRPGAVSDCGGAIGRLVDGAWLSVAGRAPAGVGLVGRAGAGPPADRLAGRGRPGGPGRLGGGPGGIPARRAYS